MGSFFVAEASDADRAAVRRVAPLAADLVLACGPFLVPVGLAASTGHAEDDPGEESDALRAFLDANPWEGMGSVTRTGWLLLARDADTVVFGQRDRPIGMGTVLTLGYVDSRFEPRGLGGGSVATGQPDERAEFVTGAMATGTSVTVTWDCGEGMDRIPNRVEAGIRVLQTPTAVHFLLVSVPNPDRPGPRSGWTTGRGRRATAVVELDHPLDGRALYNNSSIPAYPVDVVPD